MRRLLRTFTAFIILTTAALAGAASAGAASAGGAWVWPVSGEVITPYRNGTDPYATGQHRGIDIAAPIGTLVRAATAGEVRFAGTAGTSGLTIGIRTADGYDTSYLHLSSVAIRAGAHVAAGDRIGAVGTTGTRSAAAPHLHFGVRDAGTRHAYHDPLAFLPLPAAAPAPDPPPAVAPAPSPVPPATAPAPSARRTPSPRGAPAPKRAPEPRRRPTPRTAPHGLRAPRSAPRRLPVPLGVSHAIGHYPADNRQGPPLTAQSASAQDAPGRPDARPAAAPGAAAPRAPGATGSGVAVADRPLGRLADGDGARNGPDIGWALACGGLLLAAAILGLTGNGGRAGERCRSRLARALPVLGRR